MEGIVKTSSEQRYSLNGETMGTRYTALFHAAAGVDTAAVGASLFAAVDKVDRQMSTWNSASDLCRLNAAPENAWVAVPEELAHVLETGVQIGLQSHGAFDIGVGELVDAWGFGPTQRPPPSQVPAPHDARYRRARGTLEVDRARRQVRKLAPVALDLSGIAKGYGVDQLAGCLDGWGIDSYLVGIDGEMRARGSKPGGEAWAVAIEKPTFGLREVGGVMELRDTAIATSGDYRRWGQIAGKRYAHTMHPGLGQPVVNRLAAVTVLAASCMLADAWATALLVLGEDEGPALARARGMDALFVLRDGDRLEEVLILGGRLVDAG
ncbi:MAG: FAD:protein FMN transferase [Pseudomonadota bacterium]